MDGLPNSNFDLGLTASDFCPPALHPNSEALQRVVTLDASMLCDLLDEVEHDTAEVNNAYIAPLPLGVLKRKHSSSSVEELAEDDEAKFEFEEDRASAEASIADPDFITLSSGRPLSRRRRR